MMWSDACHWLVFCNFCILLVMSFHLSNAAECQCVEERLRGLISNLIRLSKQVSFDYLR